MTPEQLNKILPKIKRYLLNLESPTTIHIYDLMQKFKLPVETCTPLAARLAASTFCKVLSNNNPTPYHYTITKL